MGEKYYAVKKGLTPGIYTSWEECKVNVIGFPGALYKSFASLEEANTFLGSSLDNNNMAAGVDNIAIDNLPSVYAFVDGSYNPSTCEYGYGGFLMVDGEKYFVSGKGSADDMKEMRNVAGEILGSTAAIEKAINLGLKEISIFYDYQGIESWALGEWKRNKSGTKAYYEFIQAHKDLINIKFVKVKGHTGIPGNEEADRLAKQAVGIREKG